MAQTLRRIVGSTLFDSVVIAVILANAVVLGMQTYPDLVARHGDTLNLLNEVFLGIFVVELCSESARTAAARRRSSGAAGTSSTSS